MNMGQEKSSEGDYLSMPAASPKSGTFRQGPKIPAVVANAGDGKMSKWI
jgi:hypothetical protein